MIFVTSFIYSLYRVKHCFIVIFIWDVVLKTLKNVRFYSLFILGHIFYSDSLCRMVVFNTLTHASSFIHIFLLWFSLNMSVVLFTFYSFSSGGSALNMPVVLFTTFYSFCQGVVLKIQNFIHFHQGDIA